MVRLFTALEIPLKIAQDLERLKGGVPGARWIDRENYHITLAFIGDVDSRHAHEIDASLHEIDARGFTLRLSGVGSFGRAKPHALWAGVERTPGLSDLRDEAVRAIGRTGIAPDTRKFTPHVTLARLKYADTPALAGYLARHALFQSDWFGVDRFVLMSSRPSKGGGPYGIEREYPLEGWPVEDGV